MGRYVADEIDVEDGVAGQSRKVQSSESAGGRRLRLREDGRRHADLVQK